MFNSTRRDFLKSSAAAAGASLLFGAAVGQAAEDQGGEAKAKSPFTLATMPRIDVHTHIGNTWKALDDVMELRKAIRQQLDADLAMWISLGAADPPDMDELRKRYQGRIQFCISDYKIKDGLRFSPQELVDWQKRGVVGFKFYPGWKRASRSTSRPTSPSSTRWSRSAWWPPRPT